MTFEATELITLACNQSIAGVLAEHGLPVDSSEISHVIKPHDIRNLLIRSEYNQGRAAGIKSEALLFDLADRYCMSYETIYSITHGRRG